MSDTAWSPTVPWQPEPELRAAPALAPRTSPPVAVAARTPDPGARRASAQAGGPWFLRHWRGALPLGAACWVNGALIGGVLPLTLSGVVSGLGDRDGATLRGVAAASLVSMALLVAIQVWSAVGIWRSADRHVAGGGRAFWAGAARGLVVLGALGALGNCVALSAGNEGFEMLRLATGHDTMPVIETELSPDGRSLLLMGTFGAGSSDKVRQALRRAPSVRLVHLASRGGRLFEARTIARQIRQRGLDTYVDGQCASACTMVFLAGRDRGATPNARIGFHRASFAGVDSGALSGNSLMLAYYREAGIPQAFIDRIAATRSSDIWYPTPDELAANHVVTRVSLGGEATGLFAVAGIRSEDALRAEFAKVAFWAAVEARFPGTMARAVHAAWLAKEAGAHDDQVLAASRGVLSPLLPQVLAQAPDAVLDDFNLLVRDEMRATLAVSPEACGRFLDGRLDASAVFSRTLMQRDMAFMKTAFSAAPAPRRPASRERVGLAFRPVLARLTPEQIRVVKAPLAYAGKPRLRCESLLNLYDAIADQPSPQRELALRTIFATAG